MRGMVGVEVDKMGEGSAEPPGASPKGTLSLTQLYLSVVRLRTCREAFMEGHLGSLHWGMPEDSRCILVLALVRPWPSGR